MDENRKMSRGVLAALTIVISALCLGVVYWLRSVLTPIFIAFLIAYFLNPLINRIVARRVNRTLAIAFLLLLFVLAVTLLSLIFLPAFEDQISRFMARLPGMISTFTTNATPFVERISGMDATRLFDLGMEKLREYLSGMSGADLKPVGGFLGSTFSGTYSFVMAMVNVVLIPVFAFYFMRDFEGIKNGLGELVPFSHREIIMRVIGEIDEVLSHFVHGQALVCIALGLLYATGFTIAGVPMGFAIGLMAGLAAFIPYFGAIMGVLMSLIMVLLDWQGVGPLLGIFITLGVVQTLDSFLVTPKILGNRVGLSPVSVIIALLVGGKILGFVGVLIAVPTAAVAKIFYRYARRAYLSSNFYLGS